MTVEEQLYAIEQKLWTEGPDYYRKTMDEQCLVVFTAMAGVMTREQVASSVQDGQRWSELAIERNGFLQVQGGVAILSYKAKARRYDGTAYQALVSSGYVSRGGAWKMAFHQQTPLPADQS